MKLNVCAVAPVAVLVLLIGCKEKPIAYKGSSDVAAAMTVFSQRGQHEKAVKVGKNWIAIHPNDALIYRAIGMAFLASAQHDDHRRQDLLNQASESFESAMRLAPNDALMVNDAAWGFMTVGDLAPNDSRCRFYEKAMATFSRSEQLLVADQYRIRGESFSMEPLRKTHEKLVTELARKRVEAKCSQPLL